MKNSDLRLLQEAYANVYDSVDDNELISEGFVKDLVRAIGAFVAMATSQATGDGIPGWTEPAHKDPNRPNWEKESGTWLDEEKARAIKLKNEAEKKRLIVLYKKLEYAYKKGLIPKEKYDNLKSQLDPVLKLLDIAIPKEPKPEVSRKPRQSGSFHGAFHNKAGTLVPARQYIRGKGWVKLPSDHSLNKINTQK